MDKQEYLNQISTSNRPVKKSKASSLFSSKFFLIGAIGVVTLILIIVIGSALSGGKTSGKDTLYSLILHINNTSEVMKEYQPNLKSSELRSYSASLQSILSNTSSDLTTFATEKYNYKEKDVKKSVVEEQTAAKDELESELFEAKINGILDRVYAHKMAYEISLIAADETKILKSIKNDQLSEAINRSYNSLNNLYDKFNDFSETK